jgi:hypothetical protein
MFAAAPSGTWKVDVVHVEDLRSGPKQKKPVAGGGGGASLKESFTMKVTEEGTPRPKAVELAMVSGTLGKVTVEGGRGEAYVRLEHPPQDQRLRTGLIRYLDRIVLEDPDREKMASCEGSKDAVESWLHKTMAYITSSQPEELALKDLKVKCSKGKSGTVHEVTVGVTSDGRHSIRMSLKGKVTVDPALWVTTWTMTGPMHVVFDRAKLGVPMDGTFTSSFSLAKK